jgi:signal transduction histidine kinase
MGAQTTNDCKSYVGSLVRLRGIVTARSLQDGSTQFVLMVPDITQVLELRSPTAPIAALPVVSIDVLLNRELGPWTNTPVHLNGIVSAAQAGESLVLRDPTGMLLARVWQVTEVPAGERLNVWGYLEVSGEQSILADAYFEPVTSSIAGAPPRAASVVTNSLTTALTNITDVRALGREELMRGPPVQFRATVLYSDADWHTTFVSDGHTALYAELNQTNIAAGQIVELTGRATSGTFGPAILSTHFEPVESTNLPAAVPAELDDLADGHLDAQWVEMRGVVRQASAAWNHLHFSVMTRKGRFNVLVPGFPGTNPPAGLLDSRVVVHGICGSDLNARNQLMAITLYAPGLQQVETLKQAPADPFEIPATPIAAVATFDPERVAGGRVKVTGVVTLSLPGQGLFLQDQSGGIRVATSLSGGTEVRPGDWVEVLGFPALGEFSPHLEEPIVRRLNPGNSPDAIPVTAEQILLQGTNDARLVQLDAELLQRVPRSANPKLVLQQGPIIFVAQLASGRFADAASGWRPGSLLRLSGICVIQGTEEHAAQSFRLLLTSPAAVQVLKSPPLLSSRHLLALGGALAVLGLAALGWITALRRQVRARTAALRASQSTLQAQVELSRALSELGRRLNATATPKEAARIIVEVADHLLGWDACTCDLYESETRLMTHVLSLDLMDGRRAECQPMLAQAAPSALTRRAIERGPQLILRRPGQPSELEGIPFGDVARRSESLLYVPICHGSQVVGVLSIQSYAPDAYGEQDLAVLQALADHCSGALSRIRAQEQLVEISRRSGMAEVATGVLHNVGNVLTSVNVSASLLRDQLKNPHTARLARVCELLEAHHQELPAFFANDPKAQKIPDYLRDVVAGMSAAETQARAELQSLTKNIEHIKEIVAMQLSFARVAGVAQQISAAELIEDALRLNAAVLTRHQVQVNRDYPPDTPTLTVDKHKVLQILVNLIRNAKYACEESGRPDRKLTVGVANGQGRVRFRVADNGVGIPQENLTRIFSLGFSTRKDGHGFGLHSAAITAQELGGNLAVHSDGPGNGAAFTLDLPLVPPN